MLLMILFHSTHCRCVESSKNVAFIQRRVSGRGRATRVATFDDICNIPDPFCSGSCWRVKTRGHRITAVQVPLYVAIFGLGELRVSYRLERCRQDCFAVSHSLPIVCIRGTKISSQCWQLFASCYRYMCLSLCVRLASRPCVSRSDMMRHAYLFDARCAFWGDNVTFGDIYINVAVEYLALSLHLFSRPEYPWRKSYSM